MNKILILKLGVRAHNPTHHQPPPGPFILSALKSLVVVAESQMSGMEGLKGQFSAIVKWA